MLSILQRVPLIVIGVAMLIFWLSPDAKAQVTFNTVSTWNGNQPASNLIANSNTCSDLEYVLADVSLSWINSFPTFLSCSSDPVVNGGTVVYALNGSQLFTFTISALSGNTLNPATVTSVGAAEAVDAANIQQLQAAVASLNSTSSVNASVELIASAASSVAASMADSASFDLTNALAAFAFFFSMIIIIFMVSNSAGEILKLIRGR
jgi:hypothetical protein